MKKVLIIGKVWPEPDSSAAGHRMMRLIRLFLKQGWEITFGSPASRNAHSANLNEIGVNETTLEVNSSLFDTFLDKFQPDLVVFDRFMMEEQFGWRVAARSPEAIRILDTEDLHCLRKGRQYAWEKRRPFQPSDLYSKIAKREIASIFRSDLSLIISDAECKILEDNFNMPSGLLHHLPFMLDEITSSHTDQWPEYENRSHFVSIGNFLHEPNWNAVLYLKEGIWPIIKKKLPEAEIHIYGAYTTKRVEELHNKEQGFLVKGRARDAHEVIRNARVLLAPLRFGAGIKGKLTDAMMCGTPNVTTDIGVEGMRKNSDWAGLIANNSEEFAQAAVSLYSDKEKWLKAQETGINIINGFFADPSPSEKLIQRIETFRDIQNLKKHRDKNFTGQMLMHHHMNSTKYLSMWIEEKNRNRTG